LAYNKLGNYKPDLDPMHINNLIAFKCQRP